MNNGSNDPSLIAHSWCMLIPSHTLDARVLTISKHRDTILSHWISCGDNFVGPVKWTTPMWFAKSIQADLRHKTASFIHHVDQPLACLAMFHPSSTTHQLVKGSWDALTSIAGRTKRCKLLNGTHPTLIWFHTTHWTRYESFIGDMRRMPISYQYRW